MIKNIIFDFDGVVIDSVPIKTEAYRKLFISHDQEMVQRLVEFHEKNGGISRYLKVRYFFEEILNTHISDDKVLDYAEKYSELTKEELSKSKYIIPDVFQFIQKNYKQYNLHVASGADEEDLQYICKNLNLEKYFLSINGSPKKKNIIVEEILNHNNYTANETILIGDSINDYQAARLNSLVFYGYNNNELKILENAIYLDSMAAFPEEEVR